MKIKSIAFLIVIIMIIPHFTSCESEPVTVSTRQYFAFDTIVSVMYYGDYDERIFSEIDEILVRYENVFSATNSESDLYQLNENGTLNENEELFLVLKKALEVSASTSGAFDVTVLPLVKAWGFFDKNYKVPSASELEDALEHVSYENVILQNNNSVLLNGAAKVDLGGIAKGYVSDKIIQYLKNEDVSGGIVSVGGSSAVFGSKPDKTSYKIGIVDPTDTSKIAGAVSVRDKSVLTSGTYQRNFEKDGVLYHHILDPETGFPVNNGLLSVTVISDSGMSSDALSTALFVMGVNDACGLWASRDDFDMIVLTDDGVLYVTEGIADSLEVKDSALIGEVCVVER